MCCRTRWEVDSRSQWYERQGLGFKDRTAGGYLSRTHLLRLLRRIFARQQASPHGLVRSDHSSSYSRLLAQEHIHTIYFPNDYCVYWFLTALSCTGSSRAGLPSVSFLCKWQKCVLNVDSELENVSPKVEQAGRPKFGLTPAATAVRIQ